MVEPERVLQLLSIEEMGEISGTYFDGQGQKQEMEQEMDIKFPISKRRIAA